MTEPISLSSPYVSLAQSTTDTLEVEVIAPDLIRFPPHRNVPYTAGVPPAMDGRVATDFVTYDLGDTGWNQAHRIVFQDGAIPHLAFQCLSDRSEDYLYMSFEVRNDSSFDQYDAILLAFSPDKSAATPGDDRLVLIYPFTSSPGSGENLDVDQIKIWSEAGGWESLTPADAETNYSIVAKIKNDFSAGDAWNMEVKIPTSTATGSGSWVTLNNDFLFYFNMFRVNNSVSPKIVAEFSWPQNKPVVLGDAENYDYNPAWWGEAVKGNSDVALCNGLYFTRNDIQVTQYSTGITGTNILLPDCVGSPTASKLNNFEVTLYNNTKKEDASGANYFGITDVDVAFSVARWGLPGPDDWMKIPPDSPNTNPATGISIPFGSDVTAGLTTVYLPWTLNCDDPTDAAYITNYQPPNHHQCVYVEILDAVGLTDENGFPVPGMQPINILTRGIYRNMNFVNASEFSRTASISTGGYGLPFTGMDNHKFLIYVSRHDWSVRHNKDGKIDKEKLRIKGASAAGENNPSDCYGNDETSYLYWTASGYLYTGQSVIIKGERFELVQPAGSFGYIVAHDGPVNEWEDKIEGAEKIDSDHYELEVPPESSIDIVTRIKPIGPCGMALSLHGGPNFPLSNFSNDYGVGFNVMADIGCEISRRLSVVAFFAYNFFPAKSSGTDDTSIINIALNGAYRMPINPGMALSLRLGPDLYIQDFKDIDFGYNVGFSYLHLLSRKLELEAGVDYHSHFNQDNWFLQSHVGIIFKF